MIFKKWPKAACDRSIHPKNFDFAFHVLFSYAPRGYLFTPIQALFCLVGYERTVINSRFCFPCNKS